MPDESMLKNKSADLFDETQTNLTFIPLHKWLLISASALIFFVLPLLFIWSSLGVIHTRAYEPDGLYLDVASTDNSS